MIMDPAIFYVIRLACITTTLIAAFIAIILLIYRNSGATACPLTGNRMPRVNAPLGRGSKHKLAQSLVSTKNTKALKKPNRVRVTG